MESKRVTVCDNSSAASPPLLRSMQQRPSFPSLYKPNFALSPLIPPPAKFLNDAHDIYIFTLYWTFILYLPLFVLTGLCAAFFLIIEPLRRSNTPFSTFKSHTSSHADSNLNSTSQRIFSPRSRHRSIAYGIAILILYGLAGVLLSVLSSTVVGFLIAAVYSAGKFRVSTWIPFVWVLAQSLITLTSMCFLTIDII